MNNQEVIDNRRFNFFIIDNEAIDNYELNYMEIAVYVYLIRCANKDRTCFPGLKKIASVIKLSKPKVIECIKILERKGLIEIKKRKGEDKRNLSNIYIINEVKKKAPSKPSLPEGSKSEIPSLVNNSLPPSKPDLLEVDEFKNTHSNNITQIKNDLLKYLDSIQVEKMIMLYSFEKLEKALSLLKYMMSVYPKRVKNPSSYLYMFITGKCQFNQDQELYEKHLKAIEKEKSRVGEEQQKRITAEKEEAERKELEKKAMDYYQSLSKSEQAKIDSEVEKSLNSPLLKALGVNMTDKKQEIFDIRRVNYIIEKQLNLNKY